MFYSNIDWHSKINSGNNMEFKTTDLCDEYPDKISVANPNSFRDYGGKKSFSGMIQTVKCFENNPLVRKSIERNGNGKVLVVDGCGSMNCALLGDMLAEIAIKNKWNGIVINGCIRDSAAIGKLHIGVKALNTNPMKSGKKNEGDENVDVNFTGINFVPGEFIYCDEDGIITSKEGLL